MTEAVSKSTVFKFEPEKPGLPDLSLGEIVLDDFDTINASEIVNMFRILWIQEGFAKYQIDFKHFEVDKEIILFLSPGQVFQIEAEKIKSAKVISFQKDFYCIEMHDSEVSCNGLFFFNVYNLPYLTLTPEESSQLALTYDQLKSEIQNPGAVHSDLLKTYLKLFLIQTVRIRKERQQQQFVMIGVDNDFYRKFSQLVESHFREKHAVADYADLLNISPKSLTKKLQKITHLSPSILIQERILLEAKRELIYSNKSIKEIAFDLGFSDPAYFSRFFAKHSQESPLAFRENH